MAVTAPFCSSTALVATVVPWMNRSTVEAGAPACASTRHGASHAFEEVLGRGGDLGQEEAALLVEGHDVGERAADVDADLHVCGPLARSWILARCEAL
jgi:hypothetical protein